MLNKSAVKSSILVAILMVAAISCSMSSQQTQQQKYNKTVSQTILIYMDLETMFPDEKHRELARAAGKGNIATIDKLVTEGVDVNAQGTEKATALFWSMRNEKGFNHLLKLGANPNIVFGDGGTVMHWAARKSNCDMLKTALAYGGDPNLRASSGESPLFNTFEAVNNNGIPECLKVLLKAGADIELKNDYGGTVVLTAAGINRYDVALFLVEAGANPEAKLNDGRTLMIILNAAEGIYMKGFINEVNRLKLIERLNEMGIK